MQIINLNHKNLIETVAQTLDRGGLVILPTETVYGACVDATNKEAIEKLCQYKARPMGKPYSIFVKDQFDAAKYAEINATAKNLYERFLPGPLTIVTWGRHILPQGVESETGTIGIRISSYPLIGNVVAKFGKAITATSANASYKKRPYEINDILSNLTEKQKKLIDLIVDAGKLPGVEPSTVVDTTGETMDLLRVGGIDLGKENAVVSWSPESTKNVGKELVQKYLYSLDSGPVVFALYGEMGVGKTVISKGIGKALGVNQEMNSPTYNLEEAYETNCEGRKGRLLHADTWRTTTKEEIEQMGWRKRLGKGDVLIVEWAEKIDEWLSDWKEAKVIKVGIEYGEKENLRRIRWQELKSSKLTKEES